MGSLTTSVSFGSHSTRRSGAYAYNQTDATPPCVGAFGLKCGHTSISVSLSAPVSVELKMGIGSRVGTIQSIGMDWDGTVEGM